MLTTDRVTGIGRTRFFAKGGYMIDWKEITLADKPAIEDRICASGCHGADYSFTNLYIWRKAYKPMIAMGGERLLVGMPQWKIYAYPKGGGDVRPGIEMLLEEAHSQGDKLVIRGLTDKTLQEFLPLYGDRFEISEDRDNADYIYSVEKLCELPGRHLSSKRNHIKHFERNGEWEFHRIAADSCGMVTSCEGAGSAKVSSLDEARAFVDSFYKEKNDPELEDEAGAIEEMFANYKELGFLGGLLYQKGEPVAFTAGTRLDNEVFDTHFEKAMPGVEAAYTMVNREFARLVRAEYPDIQYFNREEDMGIEGLRRAKESYHPDILLMKYFAREK
ncbi:MAG: DUF2156 domain-containing protein [Clostridiales bacterium]|jgi:hypothetical protein|nr:DUF2156 domain-containing protein [Clostridiales bacterium]